MQPRISLRDFPGSHTSFPDPGSVDYWNNLVAQGLQSYAESIAGAVNNVPAGFTLSNSATPTVVYSETINGLYLGTSGRINRVLLGNISTNATNPGNLTIAVAYGSTSVTVLNAVALTGGVSNTPFELDIFLSGKNATNAQHLACGFYQTLTFPYLARTTAAIDSTVNQTLSVTVTFSVASANTIFVLESGG